MLVDATLSEEHVPKVELMAPAIAQSEVYQVARRGHTATTDLIIPGCNEAAAVRKQETQRVATCALEADKNTRDARGLMAQLQWRNDEKYC
jgi:hypothetical protein